MDVKKEGWREQRKKGGNKKGRGKEKLINVDKILRSVELGDLPDD